MEKNNTGKEIIKSTTLVTAMMLIFKLIGFVKQAVVAYVFGATVETDIYFIAWGFVSGISEAIVKALLVSLVAIYTETRVKKGHEAACKLINALIEVLVPIFVLLSILIYASAPLFSKTLAPSYSGQELEKLIFFLQILSPILMFGCFELLFGAIEDSFKEFLVPRLQSLVYSICVIVACLTISNLFGIYSLVIAQFISSIIFTIILFVSTKKHHDYFFVSFNQFPDLKEMIFTAIPLFIGNSALQINQIVDKSITSGLGEGAASALSYCHTLEQFITNIMIVNIGNVMFANFAEFVAKKEYNKVEKVLSKAIDILIVLLGFVSIIVFFCSSDIVSIVYFRGEFSVEAVRLTSIALIGYATSFIAVAIRDLSVKSLYAFKDTRRPMYASICSICINIILSIILSKYIGILGIALATSFSAYIGAIFNAFSLKKHLETYKYNKHFYTFAKCIPGLIVVSCVCFLVKKLFLFSYWMNFLVCTIVGLAFYITALFFSKEEEIIDLILFLRKKIICRG